LGVTTFPQNWQPTDYQQLLVHVAVSNKKRAFPNLNYHGECGAVYVEHILCLLGLLSLSHGKKRK